MSCDLLIEVESIDELTIDATTCDEEIAISIADVEEVAVEAFDYPPEIEQLNQELAAQMEAINLNAGAIAALNQSVTELDERVGELEDNVIYEEILTEDILIFRYEFTQTIQRFKLLISAPDGTNWTQTTNNAITLVVNDKSALEYHVNNSIYVGFLLGMGMGRLFSVSDFIIKNGICFYSNNTMLHNWNGAGVNTSKTYAGQTLFNVNPIQSIQIFNAFFKKGTLIKIIKV